MAYFANRAVNRVHLHSALVAFALGAGGLFFFVFLLHAGVSPTLALLSQAGVVFGRFLVRPALLPLAKRWGLKPLLLAGNAVMAAQYPLLALVHGLGATLVAVIAVAGLGEVLYWMSYNAYYAAIGDAEHRGHQLGAREALVSLIGIVAPLAGAWGLMTAGPAWTFAGVALVQLAASAPLIRVPNVAVKSAAPGAFKAASPAIWLMIADGWFDTSYLFAWQIALFVALGRSFTAYGGAMALASLVGAAGALAMGRHVDGGGGRRVVAITYGVATALILARAGSLGWAAAAVAANAAGGLLNPLLGPTIGPAIYNRSQASPCSLRFAMVTETGWDVGCFVASLIAAALFAAGAPLVSGVLLALPAIAASAAVLWRMYPRSRREALA